MPHAIIHFISYTLALYKLSVNRLVHVGVRELLCGFVLFCSSRCTFHLLHSTSVDGLCCQVTVPLLESNNHSSVKYCGYRTAMCPKNYICMQLFCISNYIQCGNICWAVKIKVRNGSNTVQHCHIRLTSNQKDVIVDSFII